MAPIQGASLLPLCSSFQRSWRVHGSADVLQPNLKRVILLGNVLLHTIAIPVAYSAPFYVIVVHYGLMLLLVVRNWRTVFDYCCSSCESCVLCFLLWLCLLRSGFVVGRGRERRRSGLLTWRSGRGDWSCIGHFWCCALAIDPLSLKLMIVFASQD